MRLQNKAKRKFKPFMAMFLAFLCAFGAMPLNVLANETENTRISAISAEPFTAKIDGENVLVPLDGMATVHVPGFDEPVQMEIPRYVYFDGEPIPVDDDRIEGLTPVVTPITPLAAGSNAEAEATPTVGFIVSASGALPSNPIVNEIGQEYTHAAYVTMNGRTISSRRYAVNVNQIFYEAFCADPNRPGPGNAGAVYELTGLDGSQFRTVLRYGFPINPALTEGVSDDMRSWHSYMTRVAVAYVSVPGATWGNFNSDTEAALEERLNGTGGAAAKAASPAITVDDVTERNASGDLPLSPTFTVGTSRRTNCRRNPFRFEWTAGTPAGTRLYVDGAHVATAPTNPTDIYSVNYGGAFLPITEFHLVMPDNSQNQTARVNLVGINNQYAGRVFVMQNPNNTAGWQDIIFYIPEALASAAYTWEYEPGGFGNLRIIKLSGETGQNLAGAVFIITGPEGFSETRTTPPSGEIVLTELVPGQYTIAEISPPPGYYLSQPTTQTVQVIADETAEATVTFVNPRNGNGNGNGSAPLPVRIQKICALGRYNIPNALIRIEGRSNFNAVTSDGQLWTINNTGIDVSIVLTEGHTTPVEQAPSADNPYPIRWLLEDGVLTIHNLPWGYYRVQEERAPDGYSLLPQHTAYSFWLLPPDLLIDAVINPNTGSATFILDENENPVAILVSFENYPFSEIIAYKHCRVTGEPLEGAHIRIEGFFVEGNAPVITDRTYVTGADGRVIFENLPAGTYTISEIFAPPGFLLDEPNFHSVNVSWGQRRYNAFGQPVTAREVPVVRFYNTPMSYLLVEKIDGDTGEPLDGAIFTVEGVDQLGERTTWTATSENGVARFEGLFVPGETYIVSEIQPPPGYVLMEGPTHHVMSYGRNTIVWRNWRNPGLTILKQCQDTGERLPGAEFTITAQGSGSPLPTDFPLITDSDGTIHVPWTLFEGESERTFIITEVVPPPGFHLSDPNWQVVTMLAGHDNTVLFQNRRMPDLTIQKRDARTGEAIEGAEFTIYKITEPGRGYITGNPFRTGSDGRIVLHGLHYGRYRIIETRPAQNFWHDPMEQNRSWIVEIRPDEDYLLIVENTLLPSLVITKFNMLTMRPVPLTHFRVEFEMPNSPNVVEIGRFVTDSNGQIILPFVDVGWYRITEIFPAPGMVLNLNNNYRQFLRPGDNSYALLQYFRNAGIHPPLSSDVTIFPPENPQTPPPTLDPNPDLGNPTPVNTPEFPFSPEEWEAMSLDARQQFLSTQISVTEGSQWLTTGGSNIFNWPANSIVIKKTCSVTGQLLPGATFNLIHTSAGVSGTLGTVIGRYTTGPSGIIVITGLVPGSYVVREEQPPTNFTLSVNNTQTAFLAPDGHSVVELNFANDPYGSLLITKRCEITNQPLQHAEFRVTRSDGTVVGTANGLFVTNAQGYVRIPNLPPDSYIVTETRAPDGFQIDGVPQTIWVGANGLTHQLNFTNVPYSSLLIRKFDSYNMTPLPGARFDVRHANGEWVGEFITDSSGLVEIQGLLGWFIITETDPPPGFALDPNPTRTVSVGPRSPTVVTFLNPRLGSLTIEKTNQFGAPLAGAQFRVRHQNGQHVGYFTTGASGMVAVPDLPSGWFYVEETRAPQGFVISEAGRSVEVGTNSVAHVTFVNLEVPSLTIVKICEDGNPLPGARFRVSEIGGAFREYVTTGQGGVASVTLPVGTFEIMEVQAPSGFVITEPARTFVARAGEHRTETFVNHRIPSIVVEKVDTEGRPLQGAEFEIRRMDGGLVQRVTTNQGGIATVAQIDPGTYQVIEIRAPQGFVPDSNAQTVTVSAGDTETVRFVNERIPSLTLEKVDENGLPLASAVFEIRTIHGELIAEVTTNHGGIANIPQLLPGVFEIMETRAPQGFEIIERARIIEVFAGQTRRERFVNYRTPSLVLEKVCGDGNPLQNAEFEVRRMDGGLVQRVTTNSGGVATVAQIPPGAYQVVETRAPEGFVLDSMAQNVEIRAGETITLRFVNHRQPRLVIEKVDGDGLPLANAVFEVRTLAGALVDEVTTNIGGLAIVEGLDTGAFEIIETVPPPGFVVVARSRVIEFTAGQTQTVRFVNLRQPGLVIEKVNAQGLPLANAEFEIRRIDGQLVHRVTINQGGVAAIEGLSPGVYEIIETRPPAGYLVVERSRVIEFFAGQSRVERFVNLTEPSLVLEKVDGNGLPLAGAEFEIRTLAGELVHRVVTNNGGVATVPNMETGTFQVTETRAPEGFVLDSNAQIIEMQAGESATLRFVNHRQPSIVIEKVCPDGNPLSGAEFEIRRVNGELVHRGVTNQGGTLIISGLEPATYEILETRAPDGFVVTEPSRVVEVVAGQTLTERFVNYRAPALIIEKVCENGEPLSGAEFEIRRLNGELVHRVVTATGGLAVIHELEPDAYQLTETRAPEGFDIVEPSRAIEIVAGETRTERFVNPRLATFVINKINAATGQPLQGVVFEITTLEGEHIRNPVTGSFEFVTDSSGLIRLPMLPPGSYVATETRPLQGFKPAEPVVFVVGHDRNYIVTVRNYPWPDYNIRKIDGHTGQPMQGVQFEISTFFANGSTGERLRNPADGSFVWTTDSAGLIRIPSLPHGTFVATETHTLPGFRLHEPIVFVVNDHEATTLTVRNYRYSEWNIRKISGDTGEPLAGVVFEVSRYFGAGTTGDRIRNPVDGSFEFVSGQNGIVRIGMLETGVFIITETRPLPGYAPADPVIITVEDGAADTTVTIRNYKMATYVIRKIDGDTNQPLQGVVFEIAHYFGNGNSGERIRNPVDGSFEFVTDSAGLINIPTLAPGTFVAIETRALPGYTPAEPIVFVVGDGQNTTIIVRNYRRPDYVVRKIDGDTNEPLQGVVFELARFFGTGGTTGERIRNPIDGGFEFITDADGIIRLPQLETGVTFILTETRSLAGYIAAEPFVFTAGDNVDTSIVIRNYRFPDFAILKIDGDTREPLQGVLFEIAHYLGQGRNGERLINPADGTNTFVTDAAGMIHLPSITPGQYVAIETRPLPGFSAAEPTIFTVDSESRVVTIHNYRVADWVIRKTDGDTGRALEGVHFEVARYFGSGQAGERLRNPVDGSTTFITDEAGLIRLPNLEPGTYIAIETRALPGFIIAEPVVFVVGERAENTTIDIQNFRAPDLTIRKINSVTRQPIQGVVFQLARINGERITNPRTGMFDFTTDRNGLIHLPAIEDGTFLVTEIRAAQGYFGLDEAVLLEINSQTRRQDYLLVIENTPASGLLILKTDANTGAPLQGVEFEVRHADGRLVRGLMADQNQPGTHANSPNIAPNGNFITDHRGMLHLNHLEAGVYHVTEVRALPGYLLDSTVHTVTITPGRLTTLEVVNEQMAGLRLYKIDSVTRRGIQGVEFRIFDFITNQEVAGPFVTDNNGVVDFTGILPAGRYTIRETREAPGYLRDTMPRTIEFRAGMITEIVWENTREAGQIQITKLSSADNQVNGLPAGSRLEGAVFEVRDWRTGNVIDQFITDARGVGVSRPLPLGRYLIEEIVAPPFYKRSDVVLDVTIEHSGQILRYEFTNEPANVGVEVRKTGPVEVMSGQPIVWNITTIANSSTIELSDFFVRDVLPAHAVRLDRIFTGTFNQSVRYSVMFRTNTNDTWRVAYDNLLSTSNNALVMSSAALGLGSNEFVTEIMYQFGTVRAGFRSVENPRIEGTVRDGLQNGYEFVNRIDLGGRVGSEWIVGNSVWQTRVFRPSPGPHPRTGW